MVSPELRGMVNNHASVAKLPVEGGTAAFLGVFGCVRNNHTRFEGGVP